MADETLDQWLDKEIEYAKNLVGHLRSYKRRSQEHEAGIRLNTLVEVRIKMRELWGLNSQMTR